jgi:F-type H+-transporting ATPase subunit epsilon
MMTLKILLPFKVFDEVKNVTRIVMETSGGSYGILPQRLDCVAAIVPGILVYETENGQEHYLALDEGVMIKTGFDVKVSVRNAVGGADLGKLHETVEQEYKLLDENEKIARQSMAKMETGFMARLEKFGEE